MKKRVKKSSPRAYFYSFEKHEFVHGRYRYLKNRNGDLFSSGLRRCEFKDTDLKDHYIYGIYRGLKGFLNSRGVVDAVIVEPFDDEFLLDSIELLISYKEKIVKDTDSGDVFGYTGYDFFFSGSEIIPFLKAIKKNSNYDINNLVTQINERRERIMQKYDIIKDKDVLNFTKEVFDEE